jgi:hypothetical protein
VPKRKPPQEKQVWARIIGRGWQIYLPSGEVLQPVSEIDPNEARRLAQRMPLYWVSYLSPIRKLTGDAAETERELALTNTSRERRASAETRAVFDGWKIEWVPVPETRAFAEKHFRGLDPAVVWRVIPQ